MVSPGLRRFVLLGYFISHFVYTPTNDPCHDTYTHGERIDHRSIAITFLVYYTYRQPHRCNLSGFGSAFRFDLLHGVQARRYHSGTHSASLLYH